MNRKVSVLRAVLVAASLAPALLVQAPAQAKNNTGALIGGLVAGALIGGAVTAAATRPDPYYYYTPPPPPPPRAYGPAYGPGYCGAPPYPPCRTPVPY